MRFRGGVHQALYEPLTSGALAYLRTAAAVTAACLAGCSARNTPVACKSRHQRCRPERHKAARHPREKLPSWQRANNARDFLSGCCF